MPTFSGVILDVSGSMRSTSTGYDADEEGGKWVRSIFDVIDDLVTNDVTSDNKVFAIGAGANRIHVAFDVIKAIQLSENEESTEPCPARCSTIERIFVILEQKGAKYIRKWAEMGIVSEAVLEQEANLLLRKLSSDKDFTSKFVNDYLPKSCRDWVDDAGGSRSFVGFIIGQMQNVQSSVVTSFRQASREDIAEVLQKAMTYLLRVSNLSIFAANEAADVLRGSNGRGKLTTERSRELHRKLKPHIYGSTPLYAAFREASSLLSNRIYQTFDKVLLVLSDGAPSDSGDANNIKSILEDNKVSVVGCYISTQNNPGVEPQRLYSVVDWRWDSGAQFLFNMSSFVPTNTVAPALFIKHGWEIDITSKTTRLFMHVNHPENVKSAVDVARKAVCSQDTLIDVLVSVSPDYYINQKNSSITAPDQIGDTCYANASATVLHLAMHRILGRDGGYPDFKTLRDEMINTCGIEGGAYTFDVLQNVCPKYRLHCQKVNSQEALQAIAKKRPVVARFELTEEDWHAFRSFYKTSPEDILTTQCFNRTRDATEMTGHAVVLTSYNSKCLYMMNSWGEDWADKGFFRIENAEVLGLEFFDIYWTKADLSSSEISYYRENGTSAARKLVNALTGLKAGVFSCPSCHVSSKVSQFTGTLSRVVCPVCSKTFDSNDGNGNILALNIYLTSLSK